MKGNIAPDSNRSTAEEAIEEHVSLDEKNVMLAVEHVSRTGLLTDLVVIDIPAGARYKHSFS
jgi:hypothetical protein